MTPASSSKAYGDIEAHRRSASYWGAQTRNQALRDLADRLSGPRDAAVTSATFEKTYRESLKKNSHPTVEPRWAGQLQHSLAAYVNAILPAESYQDAAEKVRRLGGQLLPFRDVPTNASLRKYFKI